MREYKPNQNEGKLRAIFMAFLLWGGIVFAVILVAYLLGLFKA